jgi:undecaprenyl-diphosphatase
MTGLPVSPFEAFLLGLVEGLTEYLPVSSTGHLILTAHALGHGGDPAVNAFDIVVQAGAILAVLGLYRARVAMMIRDVAAPLGRARGALSRSDWLALPGVVLARNLALAFLPAALLGPFLDDWIEHYLFFPRPVAAALVAGSLAIVALEPLRRRRARSGWGIEALSARAALVIGLVQCIAMVPGTSRSLVTILAGLAVGLSPAAAAEFSFLLGLPTLGGATVFKGVKAGDLLLTGIGPVALTIGLVTATVSAALAVKAFVAWLNRHGLVPFAVYRVLLAVAVLWVLGGW